MPLTRHGSEAWCRVCLASFGPRVKQYAEDPLFPHCNLHFPLKYRPQARCCSETDFLAKGGQPQIHVLDKLKANHRLCGSD